MSIHIVRVALLLCARTLLTPGQAIPERIELVGMVGVAVAVSIGYILFAQIGRFCALCVITVGLRRDMYWVYMVLWLMLISFRYNAEAIKWMAGVAVCRWCA